ncbi:GntR family transcriptional regulator [Longispora albida]|uniref:GntR family transcriptional regulator n=1 Tax=Longispora albida TaxID=203523 RepID=UPI00036F727B|nr:GntR family transcriptional regulator [Longispora albida]
MPPALKYQSIADDLRARIAAGEFPPGTPLPAQRALSVSYGVTLMTLRQALQVLADEGRLLLQPGRGTIVPPAGAGYRLDTLRSLSEDLREQGHTVTNEVLASGMRKPPGWVAGHLGTGSALRLERVRHVDGRPAVHQISWVAEPHGTRIKERDFQNEQLYAVLASIGVSVHSATETIRPRVVTDPVAGYLNRPAGSAVFVSDRITHGLDGRPVVVDRASIDGDLMEIRAERSAASLSIRWVK